MTITFNTEHDKFYQLLFFTENMMFINLLVNTPCVEFYDQLKRYYIKAAHIHTHGHISQYIYTVKSSTNGTTINMYNTT